MWGLSWRGLRPCPPGSLENVLLSGWALPRPLSASRYLHGPGALGGEGLTGLLGTRGHGKSIW